MRAKGKGLSICQPKVGFQLSKELAVRRLDPAREKESFAFLEFVKAAGKALTEAGGIESLTSDDRGRIYNGGLRCCRATFRLG